MAINVPGLTREPIKIGLEHAKQLNLKWAFTGYYLRVVNNLTAGGHGDAAAASGVLFNQRWAPSLHRTAAPLPIL